MKEDAINKIKKEIEAFLEYIHTCGYELDENGDLVEVKTKTLNPYSNRSEEDE